MSGEACSSSRSRIIKLFCPSLSKLVELVVSSEGEEKVDLGFISRTFGLDPATLKLNRHFISRGVDLISSSLTWNSLLSFFASRGFPTGSNARDDALIVDGKLCKSGTKRGQDPVCSDNWANQCSRLHNFRVNGNVEFQDVNTTKKKKMNADSSGTPHFSNGKDEDQQTTSCSVFSLKRKATIQDVGLLKKKKLNEGNSGIQVGCNCTSDGRKRPREEETIITRHHKRVR